jgi:hypothetical protein
MTRERFKDFIQKENPEMYKEVQGEVLQESKKRGGARKGAGRPKIQKIRIVVHSRLSEEAVSIIKTYKNDYNLKTQTDAIEELIKAGYNHKIKCHG